jgi:hypothetical protein
MTCSRLVSAICVGWNHSWFGRRPTIHFVSKFVINDHWTLRVHFQSIDDERSNVVFGHYNLLYSTHG